MGKPLVARVLGLIWIVASIAAYMGQSFVQYVGLAFFTIFGAPLLLVVAGVGVGLLLLWGQSRIYWVTVLVLVLSLAVVGLTGEYVGFAINLIILIWMLLIRNKFGKGEGVE